MPNYQNPCFAGKVGTGRAVCWLENPELPISEVDGLGVMRRCEWTGPRGSALAYQDEDGNWHAKGALPRSAHRDLCRIFGGTQTKLGPVR